MLRVLLILIATSVVYGELQCPNFSTYANINGLQENLYGTFFILYTSATVFECERITYTVDANSVTTGYVESPNCCTRVDSFDFRSTELSYSIGPAFGYTAGCPTPLFVNQTGAMKFLATTGTVSSQCLITVICHSGGYTGVYIICRQQSVPLSLFLYILLNNLLGLSTVSGLKPVNQTGCVFPINNCPA